MFDAKDQPIAVVLHDVANKLKVRIDKKVRPYRLTRIKWMTLSILEKRNGLTQSELAHELGVNGSAIARLVRRMEDRDLIYRQNDKTDRRMVRVYIKETARPVLDSLQIMSDEVAQEVLKGLTPKEQDHFLQALIIIKRNLLSLSQTVS
ncbi:MAG: MarR family transcriptional regulator [Methylocystaceae bacterium]|nr:MarR family transcriptional regulator [Methylocystaceae bacterium]